MSRQVPGDRNRGNDSGASKLLDRTPPEEWTPLQRVLSMQYRFGAGCLSYAETDACCCYSPYAEPWWEFVAPVLLRECEPGSAAAVELTNRLREYRATAGTVRQRYALL